MSDEADVLRLVAAFDRLVLRAVRRFRFYATTGTTLVRQLADGCFDSKPDDPEMPAEEGIPYLVGLPGFKVRVPAGVRAAMGYVQGSAVLSNAAHVIGFAAGGAVTEIIFDNGTKAVARVGDTVDCGHLIVAQTGTMVTSLAYLPPGIPIPPGTPPANVIALSGKITSGNPKLKA